MVPLLPSEQSSDPLVWHLRPSLNQLLPASTADLLSSCPQAPLSSYRDFLAVWATHSTTCGLNAFRQLFIVLGRD